MCQYTSVSPTFKEMAEKLEEAGERIPFSDVAIEKEQPENRIMKMKKEEG